MNNNKSAGITTPEGLFILSMVEVKWGALKRAVIQLIPEMMRPARFIPRYELAIFRGPPAQAYEPVSVKVREWISSALASPDFTLSSKYLTILYADEEIAFRRWDEITKDARRFWLGRVSGSLQTGRPTERSLFAGPKLRTIFR